MAIFRGIGGAGDSTTDATVTAVTEQATNAANSATAAASSASNAATSATNAATSETNAATSATNAAASETAAAASETAAAASETAAAASETAAAASETAAAASETAAAASESAAATSETNAATSASSASTSATAAAASATAAASSASAASTSETNAAASASAASTSETNAATSESNAATSASSASTSASNASTSETNAASSASAAATSASNASTSETNAASSASAASTSETNAAASASAASTSETNAASSASAASTSASNAATSATNASNAQTAAEAAQAAAEAAQEAIDGLYLGAQASDPTLDNNGDPVTAGDWYYNTTTAVTRIYDGSAWVNGAVSTAGFLLSGNNLSDLGSAATARTNLGLGTAATTASTDYATAAQGTLADSATQPGDNISTLTNDSGFITASDNITGNAATATTATNSYNIYVAESPDDNVTYNIPYVSPSGTANGFRDIYTDNIALTFNPSTNVFSAPTLNASVIDFTDGSAFSQVLRFGSSDDVKFFYDGINNTMEMELETTSTSFIITDNGTTRFTFNRSTGNFTATGNVTGGNLNVSNWDTAYGWGNHASAGYLTGITGESIENLSDVNTMTPTDGQVLTWDNANSRWDAADASGGGATGGGSDAVFYENEQTVTTNYTISTNKSAMSAGPITINSGVTVTVPTGSRWVVV